MSALHLFPPRPEPVEDADTLAALYALGAMEPGTAADIRRRAEANPALGEAIARWHTRLALLVDALRPEPPPPALWDMLVAEIGVPAPVARPVAAPRPATRPAPPVDARPDIPAPAPPLAKPPPPPAPPQPSAPPVVLTRPAPTPAVPSQPSPPPAVPMQPSAAPQPAAVASPAVPRPARQGAWRAIAGVAVVLAMGMAAALVVVLTLPRQPVVRSIAAIGPVSAPAPLFLAEMDAANRLTISPLATIAVPAGRALELWLLAPGAGERPKSLGVLPATGRMIALPATPAEGTQLLISMEPRTGTATGAMTGPVLYGGTLANH